MGIQFDSFLAESIQRLASHLVALIDAVIVDPEVKVLRCSMFIDSETQLLTQDWAMGARQESKAWCIHHMFEQQVADNPQAMALSYQGSERSNTMTYEQLNTRESARSLVRQAGGKVWRYCWCLYRA